MSAKLESLMRDGDMVEIPVLPLEIILEIVVVSARAPGCGGMVVYNTMWGVNKAINAALRKINVLEHYTDKSVMIGDDTDKIIYRCRGDGRIVQEIKFLHFAQHILVYRWSYSYQTIEYMYYKDNTVKITVWDRHFGVMKYHATRTRGSEYFAERAKYIKAAPNNSRVFDEYINWCPRELLDRDDQRVQRHLHSLELARRILNDDSNTG